MNLPRKSWLLVPAALVAGVVLVMGAETKENADFGAIKVAERFSVGGIGFAGVKAPAELALGRLLRQPDAAARLRKLADEAALAGQLYALLGLKSADPARYAELFPKYRDSKQKVAAASGCELYQEEVSAIASRIDSGAIVTPAAP